MNSRTERPAGFTTQRVASIDVASLTRLFDQAPDVAFFVKDAVGCYISVNDSLLKRHGLKGKSSVIGKRPCDICPGDFGRIPTEQDAKVLRTGRPLIDHLEMQWDQPHKPVWCMTTKLPICELKGTVIGLFGFSRDVRVPVNCHDIPTDFAAALEFFEQELSVDVTPAWLAQQSKLTPQRLARLTKRVYGLTPSQLIAKTRIAAASRLLLDTNKSVAEVAYACGFYDHSAFTRAFHSKTGVTPSDFRKHSGAVD